MATRSRAPAVSTAVAAAAVVLLARTDRGSNETIEGIAELIIGEATVKTHVTPLLIKLDLRDRVEAVVLAYEAGIVTPARRAPS